MLPALTTRPKQAVRQVQGLTDDSIDAYANTPLGSGGGGGGNFYNDNSESDVGISRASPPATSRATTHQNSARTMSMKKADGDESTGGVAAKVVRDRKASGDEDLSLKTGDVVRVLSSKRTGYLKCEFADQIGYVPSSYLEFVDECTGDGGSTARDGGNDTETPRADKKKKKKKKDKDRDREKRAKDRNSDGEEVVDTPTSSRSMQKVTPRAAIVESTGGADSPRKSKKKHRKHRRDDEDDPPEEAPVTSRRADKDIPEDRERPKRSSRRREKKHRERYSSASSDSGDDGGSRTRRGKKSRRRRHRRSDSDSNSSSSPDSDASNRRRRHRRHRRGSSDEEDEESDQKRRSPRRSRKNRPHGGSDASEPEDNGGKSARKSNKKHREVEAVESAGLAPLGTVSDRKQTVDAQVVEAEKIISRLEVQDKSRAGGKGSQRSEEISDHVNEGQTSSAVGGSTAAAGNSAAKDYSDRGNNDTSSRSKNKESARKDDESRTESSVSGQKGGKTTFGKQIGDKMRSFLGGGKKSERSTKNSSGILNACPGTVQGEEGWYEHGENERYYFVLVDGKWSLLYGPMSEDDFETYSTKVRNLVFLLSLFGCIES